LRTDPAARPEVERLDDTIGADFVAARSALETFDVVPMVGYDLAIRAAENYRTLRARGVTVRKTIDMIIGTFCIERRLPLLFSDRDFQPLVDHLGLRAA
jgi:predicted nucleic acid-binding protein